jgi:Carboxypeptidase regulatory-like domain
MTRTTGWVLVSVLALCLAAGAAVTPGSISGYVKDSAGVPQMGAAVEVYGTATGQHQLAYTDETGYFSLNGLLPGSYDLRASAASFLPTLREDVALSAGTARVLNITLNTLFEAIKMVPPAKRSGNEDDTWKWTLRSTANRPILRFDDGAPVIVESSQQERSFSGGLAFVAGGAGSGYASGSDLGTAFNLEHSIFSDSTLGFNGTLGYNTGIPDGILQVSYRRQGDDPGTGPQMALSIRRFAAPQNGIRLGSLQAVSFSYSNGFSIGELLDIRVGSEVQAIQFMGRANAVRPYGTLDMHLAANTMLEYKYTTSEPNQAGMGLDGPGEIAQDGPRMSLANYAPLLENAHHHEVSLSQRFGDDNSVQVAYYRDRVKDPELLGVGEITSDAGYFLPDVYSGTFSFTGGQLQAQGLRVEYERKLGESLMATFDYAYGGVLEMDQPGIDWSLVHENLQQAWRHSAALKLNGKLNHSHTTWMASYRWISGEAVTPVDMFNASSGQTDPFLNLFLRQQIPHWHFLPGGHMDAVVDLRNLLAQGYVPMLGPDGKTVYLVQSARSVRGGVSFTF